MKQIDGKWWRLGDFLSRKRASLDTFVSLKPLVWPGTYDLVVSSGGSQGTGVGATAQSVYRLLRGNLYKVFEVVDGSWNWTTTESAAVLYPDAEARGPIQVRTIRKTTGRSEISKCAVHRWNPAAFVFAPSGSCGAK